MLDIFGNLKTIVIGKIPELLAQGSIAFRQQSCRKSVNNFGASATHGNQHKAKGSNAPFQITHYLWPSNMDISALYQLYRYIWFHIQVYGTIWIYMEYFHILLYGFRAHRRRIQNYCGAFSASVSPLPRDFACRNHAFPNTELACLAVGNLPDLRLSIPPCTC